MYPKKAFREHFSMELLELLGLSGTTPQMCGDKLIYHYLKKNQHNIQNSEKTEIENFNC